jgi:hypothetical protein
MAGRQHPERVHLLAKRMFCTCGRGVSADTVGTPTRRFRRYRHEDCDRWPQMSFKSSVFEEPIAAQIASIRLTPLVLRRIRGAAVTLVAPDVSTRREALERELSRKAAAHASRKITTEAYLAEHERIARLIDELDAVPPAASGIEPDLAVAWLTDLKRSWEWADEGERAKLVAAVYRRIIVEGARFVGVELTEEAKAHGLALALPRIVALARPARLELTTFRSAT